MKIEEIHIYGFGKLENMKLANLEDFQVFYGENEAGKSTLMAFILSVLFGFPARQHQEPRYEPRGGGKYGGRLILSHPEHGRAVIERVRGKSSGDVVITLEDGTRGAEEELKRFLGNFDRSLFQSVFSFNLNGLQNVHQLKNEDLGRFLFSSGTLGTDRLAKAEAILQKELDARFKPSGKKPVLNGKLASLREIDAELKKAAAKNSLYEKLVEEKEALQLEIGMLKERIPKLSERLGKLQEWGRIEPLAREEAALTAELERLPELPFPVRGIERYETCMQLLGPFQLQVDSLKERRVALEEEIGSITVNNPLLAGEPELAACLEQLPGYEQSKLECRQLEAGIAALEDSMETLKNRLHLELGEEQITAINTGIAVKQQAEAAEHSIRMLKETKQRLDADFSEEKNSLELIEKELADAKEQLLPSMERDRLEKEALAVDETGLQQKIEDCREKIDFLEQAERREKGHASRNRLYVSALFCITAAVAIYGIFTGEWLLAAISIVAALLSAGVLIKAFSVKNEKGSGAELARLREKERELISRLSAGHSASADQAARIIEADNRLRLKAHSLEARWDQQNAQYEKVITRYEKWEEEHAMLKDQLQELCGCLRISEDIGFTMPYEAYRIIEECKNAIREKRRLRTKLDSLQQFRDETVQRFEKLGALFPGIGGKDLHLAGHLAKSMLEEEKKKLALVNEKAAKLEEIELDVKRLEKECGHHQNAAENLLALAGAGNEEEFYRLGEESGKRDAIAARIKELETELSYSMPKEERDAMLGIRNAGELSEEIAAELEAVRKRVEDLTERLAEARYELQAIEDGGAYSDTLHRFKAAKSEFEEGAKEWAVYMLAKELLHRTTARFNEYHLPRMLAKAEEYLEFLTGGNYRKLLLAPSGSGFLAERSDGVLFEANELSQATAEQIYVSIRLALAGTIYEKFGFPLIIDDGFANFDGARTKKILELLMNLENRQVLFFTCHSHLLSNFRKGQVHVLGKQPAPQQS